MYSTCSIISVCTYLPLLVSRAIPNNWLVSLVRDDVLMFVIGLVRADGNNTFRARTNIFTQSRTDPDLIHTLPRPSAVHASDCRTQNNAATLKIPAIPLLFDILIDSPPPSTRNRNLRRRRTVFQSLHATSPRSRDTASLESQ
jgi:hypothetical protein